MKNTPNSIPTTVVPFHTMKSRSDLMNLLLPKNPGSVNKKEFHKFSNAVFKHFGMCADAVAARSLAQGPKCVTKAQSNEEYPKLDTDNSDSLSYDEIKVGLDELAASQDYTPTAADWDWVKAEGAKIDTKNPGSVNKKEFHKFSNAVFKHFGMCADAVAARSLAQGPKCVTKAQSNEEYTKLDTDNSDSLSYDEIKVGLDELAASQDYTPTAADWDWVKAE